MSRNATYTIRRLAKLAHVSERTLRLYDELGLLQPSSRSDAGYRLYSSADVERLQEVLFFRELGFALRDIREFMENPAWDRREALQMQRRLIKERLRRDESILELIDRALASLEGDVRMTDEEMFEVFGDFDPRDHEAEVQERWGGTDAYVESTRRARSYAKADWQRFKAENEAINAAIAALIDARVLPDDERAGQAVERARLLIDRWFYPCSRVMHAQLGEMYVADPRFTNTYEAIRPGMARWMRDATAANAARS